MCAQVRADVSARAPLWAGSYGCWDLCRRRLGLVLASSGTFFFFSEKREKIIIMMMGQTGVVDSDTKMKADQQATRSGRQLAGRWTARWLALDVDD